MRWSEVTARPSSSTLRQFAGLCLIVFGALAGLRVWRGDTGTVTRAIAAAGGIIGVLGMIKPEAVRYVYTGWMIAAFPIGWTISRIIVTALFYLVFTPFAIVFKLSGRDALHLRRHQVRSYWTASERVERIENYYGQF
jgi:sterol desaturase/sphingolipid hydroxylase (fatty acid hydroxylase superfamily)